VRNEKFAFHGEWKLPNYGGLISFSMSPGEQGGKTTGEPLNQQDDGWGAVINGEQKEEAIFFIDR